MNDAHQALPGLRRLTPVPAWRPGADQHVRIGNLHAAAPHSCALYSKAVMPGAELQGDHCTTMPERQGLLKVRTCCFCLTYCSCRKECAAAQRFPSHWCVLSIGRSVTTCRQQVSDRQPNFSAKAKKLVHGSPAASASSLQDANCIGPTSAVRDDVLDRSTDQPFGRPTVQSQQKKKTRRAGQVCSYVEMRLRPSSPQEKAADPDGIDEQMQATHWSRVCKLCNILS